MQKQTMRLQQRQKPTQALDMDDQQALAASAERTAKKLIEKHNGDEKAIKNELLKTKTPSITGFNYAKEVLWNVKWLTSAQAQT